jgi:mono/diheme cytochrome c family protein
LILMPSEAFVHFSDEDLSAVLAYLKQVPPVDRELEPTHLRILGRALLAAGKLPLLVANQTPRIQHAGAVARDTTPEYGRYLASIAGCHGCHGEGLSGGKLGGGPPDAPPASNLTPSGLVGWSEADFVRALREGIRPAGTAINEEMPWRGLGRMTDAELRALWLYLESVPPKEFGNR